MSAHLVHGTTAPGFEVVRAAFARNLASGQELGGACALVRGGRLLVDLWGGVRAPNGAPWERDTVVLVYSVTKGFAAAGLGLLHARGLLDYDAPVATYWPEFAQHGKQAITVRALLAHRAGLAALDVPLTPALIGDPERLDAHLAAQRPGWEPGTRHAYHAISLGFYQDALARRVGGRDLRTLVRAAFAAPLGERLSMGAPLDVPRERIATIEPVQPLRALLHPRQLTPRFTLALLCPYSLTARSVRNPYLAGPADLDAPTWRALALPASNGYASARAVAALYGALVAPDAPLGVGVSAGFGQPAPDSWDAVFKRHTAYALGFMKPSRDFAFGSSPAAFGAPGVGGSFGFADPETRTGYAYVSNRLGFNVFDDPRERRLRTACEAALQSA
ncbi:MAG: serine hydrolase [Planctomycetota bacterium]|nr:serine hydrolase [Planctomycetota bacterium]